ncbi:MAG: hypothetical protein KKC76_06195 [Proteobacteria bacterium]|nr:hypothetical protein [Pseudomonadota bacterium]MBU4297611.1 hypothetical protein [Pseudomonadota bacterium]MCG2750026.1 hypothetical protein [Desulfobulbaceae bacterium]
MGLIIGDENATQGMTKAIYDKIRQVMEPIDGIEGQQLEDIRASWKKLSYAIAHGVVSHIKSNMEIKKIKTIDRVSVQGSTGTAEPSAHAHSVAIAAEDEDLEFIETNYPAGQGHVE